MKTVAIIQARMGSTRLPGKVLMEINGKPMIQHVVERTKRAVPEVILAIPNLVEDDPLEALGVNLGVTVFRGHPTDVLTRYIGAAKAAEAEIIVRITGDCPLIDPFVIAGVLECLTKDIDYSSNLLPRSYPKGLDCEALWFDALMRVDRLSKPEEREHVTLHIRNNLSLFKIANLVQNRTESNWSVDTQEDLDRVRKIHALL